MHKKQTIFDDLKEIKGYILGVVAFATAVGAFLVEVLHFHKEPSIVGVCGVSVCMLLIGYLINRSEKRQAEALDLYKKHSAERTQKLEEALVEIKGLAVESRLDNLRTLLTIYINSQPTNHDTILKIAEKYFIEYNGDWVMTNEFLQWVDRENQAGRHVYVSSSLLNTVHTREREEKNNML